MFEGSAAQIDALIERSAWVRRIARQLVGDAHEAEDIAQEAWVAALRRPADDARPIARWLGAVMRNLARERWRADRRRSARERTVARGESNDAHDANDALEQLDAHELVVAAVRALDEPYRTSIVLRYFEELAPREIAERLGVPVRTVHTRLHRALELLRAKLDRRFGGRGAWLACLAPLVRSTGGSLFGAAIVNSKVALAAGAAVLLVGVAWYAHRTSNASPSVVATQSAPRSAALAEPEPPAAQVERASVASADAPAASVAPSNPELPAAAANAAVFRGVAIDVGGQPVPRLKVARVAHGEKYTAMQAKSPRTVTDARGEFEFGALEADGSDASGRVVADDPYFADVMEPELRDPERGELALVVAARISVAGDVVDSDGAPVAGAKVTLELPPELRANLRRVLDDSVTVRYATETDERGAFAFEHLPAVAGASIVAQHAGFAPRSTPDPDRSRNDLHVVLERSVQVLRGTVVHPDGTPCPGAQVALGMVSTASDANGVFVLELAQLDAAGPSNPRVLRAIADGFQPANLECLGESASAKSAWPDPLVLRLGAPALAIHGRVVTHDGKPVPSASVRNLDLEDFGWLMHEESGMRFQVRASIETLAAGEKWTADARTDEHGEFTLRGLQARRYRLRVTDGATLSSATTAPIEAGSSDVEIRLPDEPRRARVAGVVVSGSGEPVARALVQLSRALDATKSDDEQRVYGNPVYTDDAGRFEIRDTARDADVLRVNSAGDPNGTTHPLGRDEDLEQLRIVVPLRVHFQVDLTGTSVDADNGQVLDASGQALGLLTDTGDVSYTLNLFVLNHGVSEALSCGDSAATVVLLKGATEVRRIRVHFKPGELNPVKP